MRLDGRRESNNVVDRRGRGAKGMSLGIGGIILVVIINWIMGGNPLETISQLLSSGSGMEQNTEYVETEQERELATLSRQILAGTEDVWTKLFDEMGREYIPPKLVLYNQAVQSGCGHATSQTGPFYCSADQSVYIDLSFFQQMRQTLGVNGDFAYAYVIAHEVGHHVQYLLGTLSAVHQEQRQLSEKEANKLSVRLELQADYYAGVWAYHDNKMFNSIDENDIKKGLETATAIGDDRLQMQAQGYTVPDSFNHGTSDQRMRWLKKGLETGDVEGGDSFSIAYSSL